MYVWFTQYLLASQARNSFFRSEVCHLANLVNSRFLQVLLVEFELGDSPWVYGDVSIFSFHFLEGRMFCDLHC